MKFLVLFLATIVFIIADDGFEDDIGFGDEEIIEIVKPQEENDLVIYGFVTSSTNYSYKNKSEISSAKLSTNIKMKYNGLKKQKIALTIKAYEDYKTNINNDRDFDINEFTIRQILDNNMDIIIGRQIIVWGKSDNIRITDTLNPLDNTTPAMTDIEDLRLGRVMTKSDFYINDWTISGILLHENRYSMMPEKVGDYYNSMIDKMISSTPSSSIDNTGIALSVSANLKGQDVGFYYANQYIDNQVFKTNMLGFAYNKAVSQFLIKTEIAYFDNYDNNQINSKLDSLIGLEYNGIDDGNFSLEIANKDNEIQYATRFTQGYINQTLNFTALYSGFTKDLSGGSFFRMWFDYDIDDELSTNIGMVNYSGGTKLALETIKDNDRIFASLKYNF
jgi:hypothetical protein